MRRELTFDEATAIQRALNDKAHARLVEDGHFGTLSQQALMRFQAEHNISPADGNPSQPTLDALGIPNLFAPPPAPPSPLQNWLIGLAIKQALNALKGTAMLSFLDGYKTYILGALMVLTGAAGAVGIHVPGFDISPGDAIKLIGEGLGFLFIRRAIKTGA